VEVFWELALGIGPLLWVTATLLFYGHQLVPQLDLM